MCPDGECIDAKWKCDGVEDCSGGYDEKFCGNGKIFVRFMPGQTKMEVLEI